MALVRYNGPDAVCRTHFGVRVKGEPFEMDGEEAAFVAKHLPGHEFVPADAPRADFKAQTKPAGARKK